MGHVNQLQLVRLAWLAPLAFCDRFDETEMGVLHGAKVVYVAEAPLSHRR